MIRAYFKEKRSWIAFFLTLQLFYLVISLIDPAISFSSTLYAVFLSAIGFILFLIYRYHKETRFYKSLAAWEGDLDLFKIASAESPFETMVEASLRTQTEKLKRELDQNRASLGREKDDLLAWIHEVKTPLTAMHLIIERLPDDETKASLTYEWLRIHLLLDQQLHQKRIPYLQQDLYIEAVNLKEMIHSEIKTLQSWCIQKGIGFEIELEVTNVLTDGKWLGFILRQLLTNAVKYSDASDIQITGYQKNGQTILEVTDCGRGIDPKDLPRIFDKGFTSTVAHQQQGATGMGLYLAKQAAELLSITIEVLSKRGEGTTVLTFPKQNDFHEITGM